MNSIKNIPIQVESSEQFSASETEAIARQWLEDSARTATKLDLKAHMNLVSRNVKVHGVPDNDLVQYDSWEKQCSKEFADKVLEKISYRGLLMIGRKENRIMFKTIESVKARGANASEYGLEVVIEKEEDGVWRVIQQRIMSEEEVAHDGILDTHTIQ